MEFPPPSPRRRPGRPPPPAAPGGRCDPSLPRRRRRRGRAAGAAPATAAGLAVATVAAAAMEVGRAQGVGGLTQRAVPEGGLSQSEACPRGLSQSLQAAACSANGHPGLASPAGKGLRFNSIFSCQQIGQFGNGRRRFWTDRVGAQRIGWRAGSRPPRGAHPDEAWPPARPRPPTTEGSRLVRRGPRLWRGALGGSSMASPAPRAPGRLRLSTWAPPEGALTPPAPL